MLTPAQYARLRRRLDQEERWIDSIRGRNGGASYAPDDVPKQLRPMTTNDEKSAVEVYEFVTHDPGSRYCAYLTRDPNTDGVAGHPGTPIITTWPGECLAHVTRYETRRLQGFGREYTRVYFRATDIVGRHWTGTSPGFGMYARLRRIK